jgi:hypothetical protein
MKTVIGVLLLVATVPACGHTASTGPNVPQQAKKEQAETELLETDAGKPDVGDPAPK